MSGNAGGLGIAFGPDGNLYTTNDDVVRKFNGDTGAFIADFAGGGRLDFAFGLDFGPDGDLYVASQGTNKIVRFDGMTGVYAGDVATVTDLARIMFGPDGNLYVHRALPTGGTVLKVDPATGATLESFGSLVTGFTFSPGGELWTGLFDRGAIARYDIGTGEDLGLLINPTEGRANAEGMLFVPEPSGAIAVAIGASCWLLQRRRRRVRGRAI